MALNSDDAIGRRLDRLEHENRQLRWAAVVLLGGAIAAVGVAGKLGRGTHEVQARRFVLKDESGRVRAVMGPSADGGGPEIALLNEQGEKLATLGATVEETPKFALYDRGHERVTMTSSRNGSAELAFRNPTLGVSTGLSLLPDGALNLEFFGKARSLRLGVEADGSAKLAFADPLGNPVGGLGVRASDPLDQLVVDRDGSVLFPEHEEVKPPHPLPVQVLTPLPRTPEPRDIVAAHRDDSRATPQPRSPFPAP